MRKLCVLLMALIACISLSSCSFKPDPAVSNFCSAMQKYDFETMKECIAKREVESLEEFFNDTKGKSEKTF